jgi:quinolinate synthase
VTENDALREQILRLKKELNAIIVAHNYQRPEVQDVADFVGDSLELARKCAGASADMIVFCGVHFMAETAAILNPMRTVLLAEALAGCPMADMITAEDLREWRARYPKATVVAYVNTSAAVKAESDYCCTSANALKVVESVESEEILFVPDEHLGRYVAGKTKKHMILYPGYCPTHQRLRPEHIRMAKQAHPDAEVVVHPECALDVIELADAVCSTSQMARYVRESKASKFLIGTESGLLHRLRLENPGKTFYSASNALLCPNMKRTTLSSIVKVMEQRTNVITVPEDVRRRAIAAVDRMVAVA